jgi:SAM-dependent methyltransferase
MAGIRFAHWVIGAAGMGVLRSWLRPDRAAVDARVADLERLLRTRDDDPLLALELPAPEVDAVTGYAAWAGTYDALPNPLIRAEEPAVRRLLEQAPAGRALDAACGTGRHAAFLASRGHHVTGVDGSPAMLAHAWARVPEAALAVGSLVALPIPDASVDVVVCALALMHVPDLRPAIAELTRVLRPGGLLVLSDLHPMMLTLGGSALYQGADGRMGRVAGWVHRHEDYVAAFAANRLGIEACVEPLWGEEALPMLAGPFYALAADAVRAAFVGLPGALVWGLRRR